MPDPRLIPGSGDTALNGRDLPTDRLNIGLMAAPRNAARADAAAKPGRVPVEYGPVASMQDYLRPGPAVVTGNGPIKGRN